MGRDGRVKSSCQVIWLRNRHGLGENGENPALQSSCHPSEGIPPPAQGCVQPGPASAQPKPPGLCCWGWHQTVASLGQGMHLPPRLHGHSLASTIPARAEEGSGAGEGPEQGNIFLPCQCREGRAVFTQSLCVSPPATSLAGRGVGRKAEQKAGTGVKIGEKSSPPSASCTARPQGGDDGPLGRLPVASRALLNGARALL